MSKEKFDSVSQNDRLDIEKYFGTVHKQGNQLFKQLTVRRKPVT
jgi:hypothetical protein